MTSQWAKLISVGFLRADKHFIKAVDLYTRAIELAPENAILYANRAAAHMRLENYGSALADASSAIDKDPKYIKVLLAPACVVKERDEHCSACTDLGKQNEGCRCLQTPACVCQCPDITQCKPIKRAEHFSRSKEYAQWPPAGAPHQVCCDIICALQARRGITGAPTPTWVWARSRTR